MNWMQAINNTRKIYALLYIAIGFLAKIL